MVSCEKKKKSRDKKIKKKAPALAQSPQPVSPALKKNTSLRLEQATLKKLKNRAIEADGSVQLLLEMQVNNYLNNGK